MRPRTAAQEAVDDDDRQLYEQAPFGYLLTTPDGTILKANATFLAFTGYTREQLFGQRRFVDLLTGGGRIYHETHYAPMLQMQGKAREIALDLVCADGSRLPVLVNAVLVRDEAGEAAVIRAAVFDATDRREYERELLRAKDRAEASEERGAALVRTVQQLLIPPIPPAVPGLDIAAAYRPAGIGAEVGGDFYDVFQLADDDWMAVLGDVCGKGPEAAVITALLRHTVRAAAVSAPAPADTLAIANDVLLRHETERFCTALLARLHRQGDTWRVTICAAGHPLPLLLPADGKARFVGTPGSLLGVMPSVSLPVTELELAPGDRLLLYTDGVIEGRRGGEEYGDERLRSRGAAAPMGAAGLITSVLEDVLAFQGGVPRDDIALLALTPR